MKKKQQMGTKREIKKMLQHKNIWLIVNENEILLRLTMSCL